MSREQDPISDFHPQSTRERNLELARLYTEAAAVSPSGGPIGPEDAVARAKERAKRRDSTRIIIA